MSKIGKEFEDFLRVAVTQQLNVKPKPRKSNKESFMSFQEIREYCKEYGITKEMYVNYYRMKGVSQEHTEMMMRKIFSPNEKDLEWENSEEYQSILDDPSLVFNNLSSSKD